MSQPHLDSTITKIINMNKIEDVNIEGVRKDYKFFAKSSELDEQLILNLIYKNMSQDIIRRNGSKRVSYYNANPDGNFEGHKKSEEQNNAIFQVLSKSFLGRYLNPRQMKNLIYCLKPRTIEKNSIIITEDGIGTEMYVIENGSFEIVKNNELVEIRKVGIIGEMALLHNIRRTATVRSLEKSSVWVVNLEEYIAIYDTDNLNMSKTFYECVANNKIFDDKINARKYGQYAFLQKDSVLNNDFYYIVVNKGGSVRVDNAKRDLRVKDVIDSGVVVDDLEVFFLEKKYCANQ